MSNPTDPKKILFGALYAIGAIYAPIAVGYLYNVPNAMVVGEWCAVGAFVAYVYGGETDSFSAQTNATVGIVCAITALLAGSRMGVAASTSMTIAIAEVFTAPMMGFLATFILKSGVFLSAR